jgi:hypothetical protein
MEQADSDRLHVQAPETGAETPQRSRLQAPQDFSSGTAAFRDSKAESIGEQGLPRRRIQAEQERPVLAAERQDVFESGGRDQRDSPAAPLKERVGRHGGPMHDPDRRALQAQGRESLQHGARRVLRRGPHLEHRDRAAPRRHHEIGEGSAGIDAHAERRVRFQGHLALFRKGPYTNAPSARSPEPPCSMSSAFL